MSLPRILMANSMAILLGVGSLVSAPGVQATGAIGDLWSQVAYPTSLSDDAALTSQGFCGLCHQRDGERAGPLNPYGSAISPFIGGGSTEADILAAFAAVESLNSDGDVGGFSNIAEINANTQPGWRDGDTVPSSLVGELLDPDPAGGNDPDIAVAPTTIDYGAVVVGTSVTGTEVIISNDGVDTLTIESLTLTNDAVFSLGQRVPPTPIGVAPGASQAVGVVYTPDNEGLDTGALLIGSNDPDEPEVTVSLQGTGIITTEDCFPSVDPRELAFGPVIVGTTLERPVTLTNNGIGSCTATVSVPTCVDSEFVLTSAASLDVGPGDSSIVTVAYKPINLGQDQCRIDVGIAEGNNLTVPMNGEGSFALPTDLDIKQFKASKKVSLTKGSSIISLSINVQNNGTGTGPGLLTVTGSQNGVEFVHQIVEVRDPIGGGSTKVTLQSYIPTETGEIVWTANLQDGDPDVDVAATTTQVTK